MQRKDEKMKKAILAMMIFVIASSLYGVLEEKKLMKLEDSVAKQSAQLGTARDNYLNALNGHDREALEKSFHVYSSQKKKLLELIKQKAKLKKSVVKEVKSNSLQERLENLNRRAAALQQEKPQNEEVEIEGALSLSSQMSAMRKKLKKPEYVTHKKPMRSGMEQTFDDAFERMKPISEQSEPLMAEESDIRDWTSEETKREQGLIQQGIGQKMSDQQKLLMEFDSNPGNLTVHELKTALELLSNESGKIKTIIQKASPVELVLLQMLIANTSLGNIVVQKEDKSEKKQELTLSNVIDDALKFEKNNLKNIIRVLREKAEKGITVNDLMNLKLQERVKTVDNKGLLALVKGLGTRSLGEILEKAIPNIYSFLTLLNQRQFVIANDEFEQQKNEDEEDRDEDWQFLSSISEEQIKKIIKAFDEEEKYRNKVLKSVEVDFEEKMKADALSKKEQEILSNKTLHAISLENIDFELPKVLPIVSVSTWLDWLSSLKKPGKIDILNKLKSRKIIHLIKNLVNISYDQKIFFVLTIIE